MLEDSFLRRTPAHVLALLLVPALLVACGGGGTGPYGNEDPGSPQGASGSASGTTIEMTASSGGYGSGTSFNFSPRVDTVSAGDTVTWSNGTDDTHTVTADDGSWGSTDVAADADYSRAFTETGEHPYHCTYHGSAGQDMHGTIVVVQ